MRVGPAKACRAFPEILNTHDSFAPIHHAWGAALTMRLIRGVGNVYAKVSVPELLKNKQILK